MTQQLSPAQLRRGYGPIIRRLSRCGDELPIPAKLVLLNLLERLGQNASAWPAQDTIAADTGLSVRSVIAALAHLREAGFVEVRQMPGASGRRNIYDLDLASLLNWAEHPAPDRAPKVQNPHHQDATSAVSDMQRLHDQRATPAVLKVQQVHTKIIRAEEGQSEDEQAQDRVKNSEYRHHHQQPKAGDARSRAPGGGGGGPDLTGDPIIAHAVHLYTTEIAASLTPMMAQELTEWADELCDVPHARETLDAAFRAAALEGRRSWPYVRAVLRRLRSEGWPADCSRKEEHNGRRVQRTGKRAEIDYSGWAQ